MIRIVPERNEMRGIFASLQKSRALPSSSRHDVKIDSLLSAFNEEEARENHGRTSNPGEDLATCEISGHSSLPN